MWVRRTWVSSAYPGPQTSISSARWVISRPRLRASSPQQIELDRRQMHVLAVEPHAVRPRGRPRARRRRSSARSAPGAGSAQRRLQPRDQLARAERLRDVVVGAGGERATLASSSPIADSTMIGISLHSRSRRQTSTPSAVGQHEVDDRRVGRAHRRAVQRLLDVAAGDDLVAGVAQDDLAARAGSAARRRRRACAPRRSCGRSVGRRHRIGVVSRRVGRVTQLDDERRALARERLDRDRARRWPRRSPWRSRAPARRRPGAGVGVRRRGRTARRSASRSWRGIPGPRSTTRTTISRDPTAARGPTPDGRRQWRAAFSIRLANARSSWAASARSGGRSGSIENRMSPIRAGRLRGREQHLVERASTRGAARRGRPAAATRSSSLSTSVDRRSRLRRRSRRSSSLALVARSSDAEPSAWPAARIAVSGVRRSCETDAQQRGLEVVAAAQRRGLDGLGLQRVALQARSRPVPRALGTTRSVIR